MKVYVVCRSGSFDERTLGVYTERNRAVAVATAVSKRETDNYENFYIVEYELDGPCRRPIVWGDYESPRDEANVVWTLKNPPL